MKDEDRGHKSEKILISCYEMDSSNLVGAKDGVPYAQSNLDCTGTHQGSGEKGTVRVQFVVSTPIRAPMYVEKDNRKHIQLTMHCAMIPMVLAQLDAGKCIATFEHKPNAPAGYFRNEDPQVVP